MKDDDDANDVSEMRKKKSKVVLKNPMFHMTQIEKG